MFSTEGSETSKSCKSEHPNQQLTTPWTLVPQYNLQGERKLGWLPQNKSNSLMRTRIFPAFFSIYRFSITNESNSAFAASLLESLTQPRPNNPSSSCLKGSKAEWSSSAITILGQKAVESLPHQGTCSNSGKNCVDDLLQKTATIPGKFVL